MDSNWIAMGTDADDLKALHEGIPAWMATRYWPWVHAASEYLARLSQVSVERLAAEYDERRRLTSPLAPRVRSYGIRAVLLERKDDELTLSMTDFILAKLQDINDLARMDALEDILRSSGSAWRVGARRGSSGLERRVPVGVQEAADDVMSGSGDAGKLLSEAWHAVYGINPDPEKAYSKAIKAVEEAGAQIVTPLDKVATLGKMASTMRDQGNWSLPLEDDPKNPSADALNKMIRSLHSGQQQRHGGNGDRSATQQEAETAVFLAVALVQIFHSKLLSPR